MEFDVVVDELAWWNEEQLCEKINKVSFQELGLRQVCDSQLLSYVHSSAAHGYPDAMQCIFNVAKSDSNINQLINCQNMEGWNALMQAARYGQRSIFNYLLKYCQNIDASSKLGTTALLCATRSGHLSAVKMLLDEGADVRCETYAELTPLMVAAQHGYDAIVKELLKRGCHINFTSKSAGVTALMLAVSNCHITTVKILIAMGADVGIVNKAHLTALDIATAKRKKKLEFILKQTASLKDDKDCVPVEAAIEEISFLEECSINKDAESACHSEKKSWWATLLKIQKKNESSKPETNSANLKYFPSTNNLAKISSKSTDCITEIPIVPNLGPCKSSQVKQTLQSRMELLKPSFDDEFCPYHMPLGVETT